MKEQQRPTATARFMAGLARAFAGALLFGLPLLMTMEMWWLGFLMDPLRLAIVHIALVPLLIAISFYSGFERNFHAIDNILDAFTAYLVGFLTAALMLALLAVLRREMPAEELLGKLAVQAIPCGLGAALARSLLSTQGEEEGGESEGEKEGAKEEGAGSEGQEARPEIAPYIGSLFFMIAGALIISMPVAPTEEIMLIAVRMTPWHVAALAIFSLLVSHAFVYGVHHVRQRTIPANTAPWGVFVRLSAVGYAVALLACLGMRWSFGSFDGLAFEQVIRQAVVLGFPATLGASAARLIL